MRPVRELVVVVATLLISVLAPVSCEGGRPAEHGGEPSWSKAVAEYVSTLSWRRLLLNLLDLRARTRPGAELGLDNQATWGEAVTKTLARQSTFNNVVSEILKAVTRIVGWGLLAVGLYH